MIAVRPVDSPRRVSVVGTGYLGATHAVCMALMGHEVLGVDLDPSKIATLSSGRVPFFEPGLEGALQRALASGRLRFGTDADEAAAWGDVHFVCVGTPQSIGSNAADLRNVEDAFTRIARGVTRRALLVGKSTVPVGTAARLQRMARDMSPAGAELEVAWNPEFLREGHAIEDTLRPDRLVFGVVSDWATEQLRAVYSPVLDEGTPLIVADLASAELVKVAANSFLATKISFINAMAEVCEATGADIGVLAEALGHDPRIGSRFLRPGLGFGGGCLPKDLRAFQHRAGELGISQSVDFLREIDAINLRRRIRTVDLVEEMAGGTLVEVRVTVLGVAFKPDSDDIRDAPALDVARMLHAAGATVTVYDPAAMDNARRQHPELTYAESLLDAVRDSEVVALLTEWPEFCDADPVELGAVVGQRRIVDGRLAIDAARYRAAGWDVRALGRPANPGVFELDEELTSA
jgi:UDPglucose 6-dehydrogenase